MVNNNQDSLRKQIIDAMTKYMNEHRLIGQTHEYVSSSLFENAVMPVLDAAMKAGELLLHRATTPQKPVPDAIMEWLQACCDVVEKLHPLEATASKRELLTLLYKLEDNAKQALAEARATGNHQEDTGNILTGLLSQSP